MGVTSKMKVTRILMGGPQKFVIPDYKKYTVGKHTPELMLMQQHLRQRGLKDPWVRTESWRYDMRDRMFSVKQVAFMTYTRGIIPKFAKKHNLNKFQLAKVEAAKKA